MANYFVLSEQEAQEVVKNICDWVETQCCDMWGATPTAVITTATFGHFKVEINSGGLRVSKYRPDLSTVDYEACVHFEGYSTIQRFVAAAMRIRSMLLQAEAYTRQLEATNEEHITSLALLFKSLEASV